MDEQNLRSLVKDLARDLGVKVAFICEVVDDKRERARTVALCVDDLFLESLEYELAGTPCAGVYEKGLTVHPSDVAGIYPNDKILEEWKVESYMGIPFYDSTGMIMGHLGVMDSNPLKDPNHFKPTLQAAAARVEAVMQRRGRAMQ